MKKVFIYAMGGIILPFLASCGDDKNETKYEGVNKIYLSAQDPVIEEMEDTPLTVSVDLTSACEQDMSFNFKILNDEDGILKLENNPVVIPAGKKVKEQFGVELEMEVKRLGEFSDPEQQ